MSARDLPRLRAWDIPHMFLPEARTSQPQGKTRQPNEWVVDPVLMRTDFAISRRCR